MISLERALIAPLACDAGLSKELAAESCGWARGGDSALAVLDPFFG